MSARTLSKVDEEAFIRCAAMHAENYIDRISGCLDLLISEIGDRRSANSDQLNHWSGTLAWCSALLDKEASQLRGALAGEDPRTKAEVAGQEVGS